MWREKIISLLILFVVVGFQSIPAASGSPVGFDVRQHLSTVTRYEVGKHYRGGSDEAVPPVPSGCVPIHLNLVARHGTRAPTKKRIKQLDELIAKVSKLDRKDGSKVPAWLKDFHSPWEGRTYGGELLPEGEQELYELGQRLRERYPTLFQYDYHPDVYPITATQVARSAASAVAFGMGLFEGKGRLGGSNHRAFSVITDSRDRDIHLRFHESCMAYKESKKLRKPAVQVFQDDVYRQVAAAVGPRYELDLTHEDVEGFWLLCKEEASLLNITDRACGLFNAAEVELLEWADDVQAHHLKGYGEAINYQMGVPLLEDVVSSMDQSIAADKGTQKNGAVESARLRVAHAETVIPFTCLLGLFMEGGDVKSLQSEKSMKHPARPPHQRVWKGSVVAPFGANTALVLYKCPKKAEGTVSSAENASEYLVQVLHNEKPISMPACNGRHFCPFTEFKETVAGPHLKNTFETVCKVEVTPPKISWPRRVYQRVSQILQWPFQTANLNSPDSRTCKAY
ncbi:multiple inositol-polyphosphate phosphatase / 2,3-bisphosphoglycerate 3-phosphatase [Marchantia polymorpha subsp. ruderalis]|uniref:Multiple inositol polyphosphate phosphatase 1 n=2 Tax=Marchantia polymorpha TaxID=3197 RepID=A0AAF6AKE1_MARPO|nr:hypothetical protein MARPO_0029s0098 [Marchantia polymorpha]BBM96911.1 hypothetical protein Mp_1g01490 [Marchantia polymorpha subsp. ruderalis]|eukprot:PTQ42572.1 hypothetical protein MARPO_0029s0098 [Marchantia polymorpha]